MGSGSHEPLRVLSTLATQGAWPELVGGLEAHLGCAIQTTFGPTNALLARLTSGETADVAILTREAATDLAAAGVLLPAMDIAQSWVGLAVRPGAAKPDISTTEALKTALLGAKSIAYSRVGASGIFFASLIERLGIADAVNAKAVVIPSGFTAERIVNGEAEMAIQQVSELKVVSGIEVVGEIPRILQSPAVFSAAVFAASPMRAPAEKLIAYLIGPEASRVLAASGLEAVA